MNASLKKKKKITFDFYKIIIPIFFVGLVVIFLLKNTIIQLLLTKEFLPMSTLFLWQLIGDLFKAMSLILGIRFFAKKEVKGYFITEIISFSILYVSSLVLISKFGNEGAVLAHAITYILYFFVLLIYFRRVFFVK